MTVLLPCAIIVLTQLSAITAGPSRKFNYKRNEQSESPQNTTIQLLNILFLNYKLLKELTLPSNMGELVDPNITTRHSLEMNSHKFDTIKCPLDILDQLCKFLNVSKTEKNAITSMAYISDGMNDSVFKILSYMVHIAGSLELPQFTWLPTYIGQLMQAENQYFLRLEPSYRHIAEAMVDFLRIYNWNMVSLVVSTEIPGYKRFIEEIKSIQSIREDTEHPKYFKFELSQMVLFHGFQTNDKIYDCLLNPLKRQICKSKYISILEKIQNSNDRIILFHGSKTDMKFLIYYALMSTKYSNLFGKEYVWIFSPYALIENRVDSIDPDTGYKIYLEMINKTHVVPGMFSFVYELTEKRLREDMDIASKIWSVAMEKLLTDLKSETNHSYEQILTDIISRMSCQHRNMTWEWGRRFFRTLLSSSTKNGKGDYVGFSEDGYKNDTELFLLNSRINSNKLEWVKVGTWTMSSSINEKTAIKIEGVTWPGGANKPPIGRPPEIRVRVATLQEPPFVIYGKIQEDGSCDANAIICRVQSHYLNLKDTLSQSDSEVDHTIEIRNAVNKSSNYSQACCAGLTMDLLKELMKDLKFKVDLFELGEKWSGASPEHGWNGLVHALIDGKADMVVTAFKITPNRSKLIEFSVPFQETGITIAVALRQGVISATAFLQPYDFYSWLFIFVFSVHCCGTAIFIYEWLSPHGLDRGNVAPSEHRFSLFRSLWLMWSMLFGAAVNADNPRGVASRFLASIWALFALVFLASYTANLAAFMIAEEAYYKLDGMQDFKLQFPYAVRPHFRFGTVPYGATEETIKLNFPKLLTFMKEYNRSSVDEGLKALKTGEMDAFIYDASVLEYKAAHDEGCKIRTVPNWFAISGYGIGVPKKSKLLKPIDDQILIYQKNGKLQRWKKFWMSGACKKTDQVGNSNKMLGVKNFISAFILLLGGIILSAILLMLEHCFYHYLRPKLSQWDRYGCCGLVSLSMGQLLSFEQSVNQTVDLVKHHKCRNPICESQIEKSKLELDMARRRIKKLESALSKLHAQVNVGWTKKPNSTSSKLKSLRNLSQFSRANSLNEEETIGLSPSSTYSTNATQTMISYSNKSSSERPLFQSDCNINHSAVIKHSLRKSDLYHRVDNQERVNSDQSIVITNKDLSVQCRGGKPSYNAHTVVEKESCL